ncbi:hypothetical protein HK097_010365 [Rhizophlyctis rosea]|uniref:NodB homology domain-containing protein n=1 Tax=Rhizophlyctis rosea TaxID=64517 RepID=A0AAD5S989_9FUNG|nr:hypothetical protein HK097_010365 [Rhizophlyctis rosea]
MKITLSLTLGLLTTCGICLASSREGCGTPHRRIHRREQAIPSYSCDPSKCKLPNCYCPSIIPPGGLAVSNTPQFVLLTFDDAVNTITMPLEQSVTKSKNPNGCSMPATFYVSTDYTNYHFLQTLKAAGHEIAIHTMTHPGNANRSEIDGCRKAINAYSGVSLSTIRGFRAPYLQFNMDTFQALVDLGIQYDCSISADPRTGPWPFTYDNGFPYLCDTGDCDYSRKFPGLWEIPMYALVDPSTGTEYTTMDPAGDPAFLMNLLQYNFKLHYEGYRTPMGLWLHAAWFLQDEKNDRVALLNDFIKWTREYTNNKVWYITSSQLLDWMKNPTGLDRILTDATFSCPQSGPPTPEKCNGIDDNADGRVDEGLKRTCNLGNYYTETCFACPSKLPTPSDPVPSDPNPPPDTNTGSGCMTGPPEGGCLQGSWDGTSCVCVCINEKDQTKNGYCKDGKGVCTVVKDYDPVAKTFRCPGDPVGPPAGNGNTNTATSSSTTTSSTSTTSTSSTTSNSAATSVTTTSTSTEPDPNTSGTKTDNDPNKPLNLEDYASEAPGFLSYGKTGMLAAGFIVAAFAMGWF